MTGKRKVTDTERAGWDVAEKMAEHVRLQRDTLTVAARALLHARVWIDEAPVDVRRLIGDALTEVTGVLDKDHDERNEQGGT